MTYLQENTVFTVAMYQKYVATFVLYRIECHKPIWSTVYIFPTTQIDEKFQVFKLNLLSLNVYKFKKLSQICE